MFAILLVYVTFCRSLSRSPRPRSCSLSSSFPRQGMIAFSGNTTLHRTRIRFARLRLRLFVQKGERSRTTYLRGCERHTETQRKGRGSGRESSIGPLPQQLVGMLSVTLQPVCESWHPVASSHHLSVLWFVLVSAK